MQIDPADRMDQAFYLGTYDPWLTHVMRRCVRRGDTCLDVGAHKGYVAMRLAKLVGPGGRVFAFEPDPRARVCLEDHCRRNRLPQVSVIPYALGSGTGNLAFSLSEKLGWSSFFPNEEARATVMDTVGVPVRSLDQLRRDGEVELDPARLSFVKIDTEGAEHLVLDGMRELLGASLPTLWLEVNRGSLEAAGVRPDRLETLLRQLGFALFLPCRFRRFAVPRVVLEPVRDLGQRSEAVYDLLASKRVPRSLAVRTPPGAA